MNLNVKETKTAPKAEEPKNPFAVKPGQHAILLVPTEEGPREHITEMLYALELMAADEDDRKARALPIIKDKINMKRLREEDVIFTAVVAPQKMGQRKQVAEYALKISKPVQIKGLIASQADVGAEEVEPDFSLLVDAVQAGCMPFSCKVSQDRILTLRSV